MNAERLEQIRRLEWATSDDAVVGDLPDDETAMLREQWALFGKLLKSADQEREAALQATRAEAPVFLARASAARQVAVPRRSAVVNATYRGWILAGACSLLAVLGLSLAIRAVLPGGGRHEEAVVITGSPQDSPAGIEPVSAGTSGSSAETLDLVWDDDDWDSSLARTALTVQQFHGRPRLDASLTQLEGALQEMVRDVESGSL